MKVLIFVLFSLLAVSTFAHDRLVTSAEFKPLSGNIKVRGSAEVHETQQGGHYLFLRDFKISGAVIPDVKICGRLEFSRSYCVSLLSFDRIGPSSWKIRVPMKVYEKALVFDVELVQNLALASFPE